MLIGPRERPEQGATTGRFSTRKPVPMPCSSPPHAALREAQPQGLITFRVNEPGSARHATEWKAAWGRGPVSSTSDGCPRLLQCKGLHLRHGGAVLAGVPNCNKSVHRWGSPHVAQAWPPSIRPRSRLQTIVNSRIFDLWRVTVCDMSIGQLEQFAPTSYFAMSQKSLAPLIARLPLHGHLCGALLDST